MEKLSVDTPKEWLAATHLKLMQPVPPIYVRESVVYEFYQWSHKKAKLTGFAMGMGAAVIVAATSKLIGI